MKASRAEYQRLRRERLRGGVPDRRLRPHEPLTDEQRAMVSTPEALEVVRRVALKMSRYRSPEEIDDMIGAGYLGLVRCVQNHDASNPVPFLVWCAVCVRYAIKDHFRDLMPAGVPRRGRDTTVHISALMRPHEVDFDFVDDAPAVGTDCEYADLVEVWSRRVSRHLSRVFRLKAAGLPYADICRETGLAHSSVERHLSEIRRELSEVQL